MGISSAMRRGPSPLIQVAALGQMLAEALEQLDDEEIASEALLADLRDMCQRATAELARESADS
jgi:hypothetical protein